jgi:hypothetical protein
MESMLRISQYSYLYLKLAKTLCLSFYLLCFLFHKIREKRAEQILPASGRRRGVAHIMYTHLLKCKCIIIKNQQKYSFKMKKIKQRRFQV